MSVSFGVRAVVITVFNIIHPIKFYRMVWHSLKHKHHTMTIDCVNFNYDVWCQECGEVFSDEIQ